MTFHGQVPIVKAELNCTTDTGRWQERKWSTVAAALDAKAGRVSAALPRETTVYYFNLIDARDLVVSSEHEELSAKKATVRRPG